MVAYYVSAPRREAVVLVASRQNFRPIKWEFHHEQPVDPMVKGAEGASSLLHETQVSIVDGN